MTSENATDPVQSLITESRAQRITKALEKDPVFAKRLGPKNVEVSKRGGGVVLHYQATVDIIHKLKDDGIEVAEATKDQLLGYSCDYFKLPRPASLDLDESNASSDEPEPPSPTPNVTVEAVAPEPTPEVEHEPEAEKPKPAPKPVPVKLPKAKTSPPPLPKPATVETPAAPAVQSEAKAEEPRLSEGTLEGPPALAIYVLLLSSIQLASVDKTKGSDERRKSLDRVAREYGRVIGSK